MRSCWQIRQDLVEKNGNSTPDGERDGHKLNGWLVDCAHCAVFTSEVSCWEQCSGSPCCCAPLHVTCDFCVLYIEHRREITEMLHANGNPLLSSGPSAHPDGAVRQSIYAKGETSATMEKLQLSIPDLWADHHVLTVRTALTALDGVQDVIASSAFRMVALSYDPAIISPGAIMAALEDAGYAVATDGTGVIAEHVPTAERGFDPAWFRLGMRKQTTDERDLKTKR